MHSPQHIILFGGEPLLNQEIKEICQYIKNEFPEIQITIFTNGLLLDSWNEEDFLLMKKLNIHFLITMYPIEQSIKNTEKQE
jgi:MoaA/NifB/PqqE/SkfB family radical SAM enzyme